jgi:hypothetical protein
MKRRLHHAAWRRGGRVAARGKGGAGDDGNRLCQQRDNEIAVYHQQ